MITNTIHIKLAIYRLTIAGKEPALTIMDSLHNK